MKSQVHFYRSLAALFLCVCLSPATPVTGQEAKPREDELLVTAREIITKARFCALVTVSGNGGPNARTIDPLAPDEAMVIWFATNPRSRKVKEIQRNPRVALYYSLPAEDAYVTITGKARLVNDPLEKARRWKNEWKEFYPNRDKDFLLFELTPDTLEVVSIAKGVVGSSTTWAPPTIKFPLR